MNHNDRAITALVMLAHSAVHTYEMVVPLFVGIWLVEFETIALGGIEAEVTTATIGVIITIGYGLFGLGALPAGVLVDRIGSRRLITVCLFGMGTSYVLLGVASSMAVVALALILWGVAASVYHPAGLSLISKGIQNRGTGFAYHGIAGNLGIGLGPLIAALLLLFADWRTVAIFLGLPALAATAYAAQADFDERAATEDTPIVDGESKATAGASSPTEFLTESKRLFTSGFALVFLIVVCSGLYYRGVLTFMPELLRGLSSFAPIPVAGLIPEPLSGILGVDSTSGRMLNPEDYFYSGLLLIGTLGQYLGGIFTDSITNEYGIAAIFAMLALIAILFVPILNMGIIPVLLLGTILGITLFAAQPLYQATVAEYTPAGTRGLSYGYTYLGVFGVGAFGGGIAGIVLTYVNKQILFFTLAGFALLAALIGVVLKNK